MNAPRVDRLARALAAGTDRRRVLGGLLAAVAAPAGLTAFGVARAAAQEGTPPADRAPNWLYVQAFTSATLAPDPGAPDRYVLTVAGVDREVLAFADGPKRRVRTLPTGDFVTAVAGAGADPPKATLEASLRLGERALVAVELLSAEREAAAGAVTFRVRLLPEEEGPVRALAEPLAAPAGEQAFGPGHLFVDSACGRDCLPSPCGCSCDPAYECPVVPDPTKIATGAWTAYPT